MSVERLREIMSRLRDPDGGCPWDLQQDFSSIAVYTLEEAYEVIDAIAREDYLELADELGDLLLQVVFHAQMAEEQSLFSFDEVAERICEKMVRRHPHVFANEQQQKSSEQQIKKVWEEEKRKERAEKQQHGLLDNVAHALPALKRAQKLQKRAANVGFDWPELAPVFAKLHEEINELQQAQSTDDNDAISEELGDLLFSCVNLARHFRVDAETALMAANRKFERRFRFIEKQLQQQQRKVEQCTLQELDQLWELAKRDEQ